jgi:hypothetical protein
VQGQRKKRFSLAGKLSLARPNHHKTAGFTSVKEGQEHFRGKTLPVLPVLPPWRARRFFGKGN